MPTFLKFAACVCFASLLACARYEPTYQRDALRPITDGTQMPEEDLIYSFYLAGSAGGVDDIADAPALQLLQRSLARADEKSTALFLGDNLFPTGFPKKDADDRAAAEAQLDAEIAALRGFPGNVAFLPGDHDWAKYGIPGVERQEDYLKEKLDEDVFLPENGCGDPQLLELAPDVALLIVNSQWFVATWDEYQELNEGCDSQTRRMMRWRLAGLVKDVRFKHVVVAMHHPLISRGPHGGEYNFREGFKQGSGPPGVNFVRSKLGFQQDLFYPRMIELRDMLTDLFDEHPSVTFVSGHEYLLQYGEYKDHPVVGSGTASQITAGKPGQGTSFTAGVLGFAKLSYFASGEAWVQYFEADGSPSGKLLFEKKLYTLEFPQDAFEYPLYESDADSMTYAVFGGYREFGPLYRGLFGTNNKELFTTEYTYPILRLDEFDGGLKVTERGGGGQTNSLRLETADGREYALRSIRKDPTRLLPAAARVGPLITLTQDVFFTANPFAALTAAQLAEGVGVPHANPQLVYLPAQPGLGTLNSAFADDLYLIEERPNDEWVENSDVFGKPDDIDGRDDVLEKIQESPDDRMDQSALVRARLLDVLLGDFDRHGDQWRYAEYKDEKTGVSYWRVIPRDRDQAMLRINGAALKFAGRTLPAVREVQDFDRRQPFIEDFTFQARFLDRRFLNELTREDWLSAARSVQGALSDEEIERSFDDWPLAAQGSGRREEYIGYLKARRDDLVDYAERLYEFQAENVYIVGTDEDDYFDVKRWPDGRVTVDIYGFKGQKKGRRYYHRVFSPEETGSIQLFGLREEDYYDIHGESSGRSIKIRVVPGPEKDKVVTTDDARALRKRTRVYAWPGEDSLAVNANTRKHLTRFQAYNQYDYRGVDYDYNLYLPTAGFNVDDGVILGLTYQRHHYTYQRHFRQALTGTFATASGGLRLGYDLNIADVSPRMDVGLNLAYQTPSYAINFFGLGNETDEIPRDSLPDGRAFYRTRQQLFGIYPRVTFRNAHHPGGFSLGIGAESVRLDRTPDRIFDANSELYPADSALFDRAYYVGTGLRYEFGNYDNGSYRREGIHFVTNAQYRYRVDPETTNIVSMDAALTIYQHLWKGATFVTRVGGGASFGDWYFYNGQTLGADKLRGYRRERFVGDGAVYQNIDLRQQIGKVLYSRFGVFGSFDHGRVWLDGQDSDQWHRAYGGGLFLRPLSLFTITAGYFIPEDDSQAVVRVVAGFDF